MVLSGKWDELAWNGIQFEKPVEWQPAVISAYRLVLERSGVISCEIQWKPAIHQTDPESLLNQFLARYRKKGISFTRAKWTCPSALSVDTRFQWIFFHWADAEFRGDGFITICLTCGNATLIRFYNTGMPKNGARVAARLLNTLADHSQHSNVLWAVYDIRAFLPKTFQLASHQFLPGAFTLAFSENRHGLTLYRFSPASTLLENQTLEEFAGRMPVPPSGNPVRATPDVVEWAGISPVSSGSIWKKLACMGRRSVSRRLRLWHIPIRNRILAVEGTGRLATDSDAFDRICSDYACIPA